MTFTSRTARRDPPIASSDQFSQLVNAEFMMRAVTTDGRFLKYASNPHGVTQTFTVCVLQSARHYGMHTTWHGIDSCSHPLNPAPHSLLCLLSSGGVVFRDQVAVSGGAVRAGFGGSESGIKSPSLVLLVPCRPPCSFSGGVRIFGSQFSETK